MRIKELLLAFLLYLSTVYWAGSYLLIIMCLLYLPKLKIIDFKNKFFYLIAIIITLSLLNFTFSTLNGNIDVSSSQSVLQYFPYAILLIPTCIISRYINRRVLIYAMYLICIEIFIGCLEYKSGVPSFFNIPNIDNDNFLGETLLYNKRVFGLSENSSVLAIKSLIGIIIIYLYDLKRYRNVFISIMIIGLFITFNRTYILAAMLILISLYYKIYIKTSKYKLLYYICITILFVIIITNYFAIFEMQFLRDSSTNDINHISAERDIIYVYYWNYFVNHWCCGNGSVKYWVELLPGMYYHGHNSFLMTLASNGLFISLLYFYLFRFTTRRTLIPILGLIFSSLTQYTIFWGISFIDILLFTILLDNENILKGKTRNYIQ